LPIRRLLRSILARRVSRVDDFSNMYYFTWVYWKWEVSELGKDDMAQIVLHE
jgi:hypothetical protein